MTGDHLVIEKAIRAALDSHSLGAGRLSHSHLQPSIATELRKHGMTVVEEDGSLVPLGVEIWRDWNDPTRVEHARGRRRIDMTIRRGDSVLGMVEVEHDLADLPVAKGMPRSNRNGTYAVRSIGRNGDGRFFESYKPLERMAVALHALAPAGRVPLNAIVSDKESDHNPLGVAVFVVVELCRSSDERILRDRLRSLGGTLLSK